MNPSGFRRVRDGALALAALTVCSRCCAQTRKIHVFQPHETLSAVARHYHVSVKDIAAANHLANPDSVPDFTRLVIPNAPRATVVAPTMHRRAALNADRVSVRLGPGESNRRISMFDSGAPMVVTAVRDGWVQVKLPDGRRGWVKEEFLAYAGASRRHEAHSERRVALAEKHSASRRKEILAHPPRHERIARAEPKTHRHAAEVAREESARKRRHKAERIAKAQNHSRQKRIAQTRHSERKAVRIARRHVPEASAPTAGSDIVRTAYAYRGTPYVYGGSSRGGFDCSGFTSYLYRRKGISLPHSARAQFQMGHKVGRGSLKPGDLVFFHTVTPGISHVGMYVGNGHFVHASSRRDGGVRVDSLNSGYYSERFRGARRMRK